MALPPLGGVAGTLYTGEGLAVANARLTIRETGTSFDRTTYTDATGQYLFGRDAMLKQLDDDEYEVREAATVKLAGLRPEIDQQLKRALKESKSFEVTMRLERILDDGKSSRPVEATRTTRAEWAMTRLKQMIDDESAAKNDKP